MKQISFFLLYFFFSFSNVIANDQENFLKWKKNFKVLALKKGISESTFDKAMKHVKFLPNVIKYDRYQPEFYEDTFTYIKKRSSKKKIKNGEKLGFSERARAVNKGLLPSKAKKRKNVKK